MLFFLPIYGMEHTMDSLKIYERLKNAKFDEAKAKELASIFSLFAETSPASKQDLRETELRSVREMKEIESKLSKDISEIEAKLSKDISEIEAKLTIEMKDMELRISKEIEGIRSSSVRWVAGLMLVNTGLMVSMLKLL
jgi:hypothetical protein